MLSSTFAYSCERCSDPVTLTTVQFDARSGRVLCETCTPAPKPSTSARQLRARARKPPPARTGPCCDECGHRTCRKHLRLDANLRPSYALLCSSCGVRLGFRPLSYERPYFEAKGREHLRGAA